MPLSNSFVKRVGKEDRYPCKGWHPLIIGELTILLSIFRAYQISDTPFLLLYHCSLSLDSLIDCGILCIKIFFLLQNLRFSASKSFFRSRTWGFRHQNLFSAPEPEVFSIKIFFLLRNLRFSVSKSFFCSRTWGFQHQNLFCFPNCGIKRRMYHQESWYILLFLIRFTFHPRERNTTPIRF